MDRVAGLHWASGRDLDGELGATCGTLWRTWGDLRNLVENLGQLAEPCGALGATCGTLLSTWLGLEGVRRTWLGLEDVRRTLLGVNVLG